MAEKDLGDGNAENKSKFSTLWDEFAGSTGFHGINKVSLDTSNIRVVIRSVIWTVLFLVSAGLLLYIMVTEFITYYSYPTLTSSYIDVSDGHTYFPTVTVCADDPIDTDYMSIYFDNSFQDEEDFPVIEYTHFVQYSNIRKGSSCRRFNGDGSLTTKKFGPYSGFSLEVTSTEIQVMIHDSRDEPDIIRTARTFRNGTTSFIEVHGKRYKSLPSPYTAYGNQVCNDAPEYSHYKCLQQCYKDILRRQCGCVMDSTPAAGEVYCHSDYTARSCADTLSLDLEWNTPSCNCHTECDVMSYDQLISTVTNKDDGYKHWLNIRVYLKDLTTTVTEQVPKYDAMITLLANLGGQMGLFIGASILTIIDVIEFVWFIIYTAIKRKKSNKTALQGFT